MRIGYLGLGSNLGDRRAFMQAAIEDLWGHGVTVLASSSVYETEPVGEVTDQPAFLNACVEVETRLRPDSLLAACKAVEAALGRSADGIRHGPRPIDVDILALEGERVDEPHLCIPHRDLAARRFVLVPLVEIAPGLEVPGVGSVREALDGLPAGQDVRRAGPPLEL